MMLQMLMGSSGGVVSPLPGGAAFDFAASPSSASASVSFGTDGSISLTGGGSQSWFSPNVAGVGASFWVRATLNSGAVSSGTTGSWLQLNSSRSWTCNRTGIGAISANLTIEIALDSGGSQIVATGTYTIEAEVG